MFVVITFYTDISPNPCSSSGKILKQKAKAKRIPNHYNCLLSRVKSQMSFSSLSIVHLCSYRSAE